MLEGILVSQRRARPWGSAMHTAALFSSNGRRAAGWASARFCATAGTLAHRLDGCGAGHSMVSRSASANLVIIAFGIHSPRRTSKVALRPLNGRRGRAVLYNHFLLAATTMFSKGLVQPDDGGRTLYEFFDATIIEWPLRALRHTSIIIGLIVEPLCFFKNNPFEWISCHTRKRMGLVFHTIEIVMKWYFNNIRNMPHFGIFGHRMEFGFFV
jgi:hypothetical protein